MAEVVAEGDMFDDESLFEDTGDDQMYFVAGDNSPRIDGAQSASRGSIADPKVRAEKLHLAAIKRHMEVASNHARDSEQLVLRLAEKRSQLATKLVTLRSEYGRIEGLIQHLDLLAQQGAGTSRTDAQLQLHYEQQTIIQCEIDDVQDLDERLMKQQDERLMKQQAAAHVLTTAVHDGAAINDVLSRRNKSHSLLRVQQERDQAAAAARTLARTTAAIAVADQKQRDRLLASAATQEQRTAADIKGRIALKSMAATKDRELSAVRDDELRRTHAILELKASRDKAALATKQGIEVRNRKQAVLDKAEADERAEILSAGGNPDLVLGRRKLQAASQKEMESAQLARHDREVAVAERLLQEDKRTAKMETQRRNFLANSLPRPPRASLGSKSAAASHENLTAPPKPILPYMHNGSNDQIKSNASIESNNLTSRDLDDLSRNLDDLWGTQDSFAYDRIDPTDLDHDVTSIDGDVIAPSYEPIWGVTLAEYDEAVAADATSNQGISTRTVHLETPSGSLNKVHGRPPSKLETDRLQAALVRQRQNLLQAQTLAGKEATFAWKPAKPLFSDCAPGITQRLKITLINITAAALSFKPFKSPHPDISFEFSVHAALPPGLSADVTVVYTPSKNAEDCEHSLLFVTPDGPFAIPLQCSMRKLSVVVAASITFGSLAIGSNKTTSLVLTNNGGFDASWSLSVPVQPLVPVRPKSSRGPPLLSDDKITLAMETLGTETLTTSLADVTLADISTKTNHSTTEPTSIQASTGNVVIDGPYRGLLAIGASVAVPVVFTPSCLGTYVGQLDLTLSAESAGSSTTTKPISVHANVTDVAVDFSEGVLDFQSCVHSVTYGGYLHVVNNGTSISKANLSFPIAARPFFKLAQRSILVQPSSTLSVAIRFTPTPAIFSALPDRATMATGIVSVPLTLSVEGQARDSEAVVTAHVTPGSISITPTILDFGDVTTVESAVVVVTVTNKSCLPQRFAFVDLPDTIVVQPGCGFGCLLPFESITCDVIYSPIHAPLYHAPITFSLRCVWQHGELLLPCNARAVISPLSVSSAQILFRPTAPGGLTSASLVISNTSAVPRNFVITASPTDVTHGDANVTKVLSDVTPGPSVVTTSTATTAAKSVVISGVGSGVGSGDVTFNSEMIRCQPSQGLLLPGATQSVTVYFSPLATLQVTVDQVLNAFLLIRSVPQSTPFSVVDDVSRSSGVRIILSLPLAPPSIVLTCESNAGHVAFPAMGLGQRLCRTVVLTNKSDLTITPRCTPLDPNGPFSIVAAMRALAPGQKRTIKISFEPVQPCLYRETVVFSCGTTRIPLLLQGEGLQPTLTVLPAEILFGDVQVGQYSEAKVKLTNTAAFPVSCTVSIANNSRPFLAPVDTVTGVFMVLRDHGVVNVGQTSAFTTTMTHLTIAAGQATDLTIAFQADRPSLYYSDTALISVGQSPICIPICSLRLRARAWVSAFMLTGADDVGPCPEDCLYKVLANDLRTTEIPEEARTLLFKVASNGDGIMAGKSSRDIFLALVPEDKSKNKEEKDSKADKLKAKEKPVGAEFTIDFSERRPGDGANMFTSDVTKGGLDSNSTAVKKISFCYPSPTPITVLHTCGGLPRPLARSECMVLCKVNGEPVYRFRVSLQAILVE